MAQTSKRGHGRSKFVRQPNETATEFLRRMVAFRAAHPRRGAHTAAAGSGRYGIDKPRPSSEGYCVNCAKVGIKRFILGGEKGMHTHFMRAHH